TLRRHRGGGGARVTADVNRNGGERGARRQGATGHRRFPVAGAALEQGEQRAGALRRVFGLFFAAGSATGSADGITHVGRRRAGGQRQGVQGSRAAPAAVGEAPVKQ